ncbi:uncharacterized protein FIBRA_03234 [Fibroporia radiculosa]|uniref:Uncharacterized protein n=1 Tax=Fibroporia radiculosa TaxID=599839 RepID=J4I9H8_9APHY|nr:uncharacterized protein FIBRA_03234 [Fibroporia radiculosa]CCM01186.1 predicted protein [Fibroporia radiculosa]
MGRLLRLEAGAIAPSVDGRAAEHATYYGSGLLSYTVVRAMYRNKQNADGL